MVLLPFRFRKRDATEKVNYCNRKAPTKLSTIHRDASNSGTYSADGVRIACLHARIVIGVHFRGRIARADQSFGKLHRRRDTVDHRNARCIAQPVAQGCHSRAAKNNRFCPIFTLGEFDLVEQKALRFLRIFFQTQNR